MAARDRVTSLPGEGGSPAERAGLRAALRGGVRRETWESGREGGAGLRAVPGEGGRPTPEGAEGSGEGPVGPRTGRRQSREPRNSGGRAREAGEQRQARGTRGGGRAVEGQRGLFRGSVS